MEPDSSTDLYLDRLSPEDGSAYRAASPGLDLGEEIRLMRVLLAYLAGDIEGHHKLITSVVTALVRAVTVQARRSGDASDLERALEDAAESVLDGDEL